jgi:predicted ATPase
MMYGLAMISRLYAHNFRCLENFELALGDLPSVLLIGRNGAGKSTVGAVLEVLQRIGRGTTRVGDLVKPRDLTRGRTDSPVRFEIEVSLKNRHYSYSVAFELPDGFRELRVLEERLSVDGKPIFSRELAQVRLARTGRTSEAGFRIDWHLVALPIVQDLSSNDPLFLFREWLANVLILRPVPSLMKGSSEDATLRPDTQVTNIGAWFAGINAHSPSAYSNIQNYLKELMPDFQEIKNPILLRDFRNLSFIFYDGVGSAELALEDMSDGERCFFVFALTIAANMAYGPVLCFWDEPDNFLAPAEIGPSIVALRKAFRDTGQLIVTSHNPEAIERFSDENTLVLYRNSHLEPTVKTSAAELRASKKFEGGFVDALRRGDIPPAGDPGA